MSTIAENIAAIRARIDTAARTTGRTGADITLVAATKMNDAARVREAVAAGIDADAAKGVSTLDIVDDGGYNIVTVQADTVPAQLKNAAAGSIAVINGNYALAAGLKISDALASEDANGAAAQTYANIIAVRAGDENSPKTQALLKALKTDAVKQYIADTYNGAVVASF